ncbi:MAG: 3'-5' exonuclease [Anaerolineaceae bacterium]|nr:3'-5' exonuclease [Anaerolineaceae bacterium]
MILQPQDEFFIIVDIESAGPAPSKYAMLSIGACTLSQPRRTFYVELIPDRTLTEPEAMQIHGLSMQTLEQQGKSPDQALQLFIQWIQHVTPQGVVPIFTAFNAPFDWMFVNDYFHRYLGANPFGHAALDIKAFYMGLHGVQWRQTSHKAINAYYAIDHKLTHHALEDAVMEAELLEVILKESETTHLAEDKNDKPK